MDSKKYTIFHYDNVTTKKEDSVIVEQERIISLPDGEKVSLVASPSHFDVLEKGAFIALGYEKMPSVIKESCTVDEIVAGINRLSEISELFSTTGGAHVAALLEDGYIHRFYEDVSRTTALYKLIGSFFMRPVSATRATILLTSRINRQLMHAVLASGIPGVAAISAPTDKAIDMAREHNLFLAGFVRNGKMNIY